MIHGEVCPNCGSKDTTDNKISYTYDSVAKTSADWVCNSCGAEYDVIYKAEKIILTTEDEDSITEQYIPL